MIAWTNRERTSILFAFTAIFLIAAFNITSLRLSSHFLHFFFPDITTFLAAQAKKGKLDARSWWEQRDTHAIGHFSFPPHIRYLESQVLSPLPLCGAQVFEHFNSKTISSSDYFLRTDDDFRMRPLRLLLEKFFSQSFGESDLLFVSDNLVLYQIDPNTIGMWSIDTVTSLQETNGMVHFVFPESNGHDPYTWISHSIISSKQGSETLRQLLIKQ